MFLAAGLVHVVHGCMMLHVHVLFCGACTLYVFQFSLFNIFFKQGLYIYMYVLYSINSQDGGEAAGFKTLPKHMISHITWRPTRRGLTKEGAPQHFRTMTSCFILIPRDPSTFSEGDWRLFMSWRAQVLSEKVCGSLGFF